MFGKEGGWFSRYTLSEWQELRPTLEAEVDEVMAAMGFENRSYAMYRDSMMGGGDRYFNPKHHVLHDDGLLTIKASGYEDDSEHWTGHMTLSPSEAEYRFWYWMACIRQVPELVRERDLAAWKEEYANSQSASKEVVLTR